MKRIAANTIEVLEPDITDLTQLASAINEHHAEVELGIKKALQHAVEAGSLLSQAKEEVEHGRWLPWLQENTRISKRTAQIYMRLAENWSEIEAKCAAPVALLSVRGALKLLEKPTSGQGKGNENSEKHYVDDDPKAECDAICDEYLDLSEAAREKFHNWLRDNCDTEVLPGYWSDYKRWAEETGLGL